MGGLTGTAARHSADNASRVVVILETNPHVWGMPAASSGGATVAWAASAPPFHRVLQDVLVFVNSILLLHHLNEVVLVATGSSTWKILFDSSARVGCAAGSVRLTGVSSSNAQGQQPQSAPVLHRLEEFVGEEEAAWSRQGEEGNRGTLLSGALSMALCYIRKRANGSGSSPQLQPRILCVQSSSDAPQQYVAVMNAIFSAQRYDVPVDACIVGSQHSAFLQQAAHITGGVYLKSLQCEGLVQYLMMLFTTDLGSRQFLLLPSSAGVDFRASCFCHKKIIDTGYVCSVCLSIFCKSQQVCSTCRADFASSKGASLHAVGSNGVRTDA